MRGKLDREIVVATALRLLSEVGLDELSLRRVAGELGVQPGALYRHFVSKEDLLAAMADQMFAAEMAALDRPAPGADWADWLTDRSRAVRRAMLAYRDGGRLKEHMREPADQWPGLELLLQMMEGAGFTVEQAMAAISALGNHILGAVIAEQEAAQRRTRTSAIDPRRFPRIAAAAAAREENRDFNREFEYGLTICITGLRHLTPRPA